MVEVNVLAQVVQRLLHLLINSESALGVGRSGDALHGSSDSVEVVLCERVAGNHLARLLVFHHELILPAFGQSLCSLLERLHVVAAVQQLEVTPRQPVVARAGVGSQADFYVALFELYPRDVVDTLTGIEQRVGTSTAVGLAAGVLLDEGLVVAHLQHGGHAVARHGIQTQRVDAGRHVDGLLQGVAGAVPELTDAHVDTVDIEDLRRGTAIPRCDRLALVVGDYPAVNAALIGVRVDDVIGRDVGRIEPRVGLLQLLLKFCVGGFHFLQRSVLIGNDSLIGCHVDVQFFGIVDFLGQFDLGVVNSYIGSVDKLELAHLGCVSVDDVVVQTPGLASVAGVASVVVVHTESLTLYILVLLFEHRGQTLGHGELVGVRGNLGDLPDTALVPVHLVGEAALDTLTRLTIVPTVDRVAGSTRDVGAVEPVLAVGQLGDFGAVLFGTDYGAIVFLVLDDVLQTNLLDDGLSAPAFTLADIHAGTYVHDIHFGSDCQRLSLRFGHVDGPCRSACHNCYEKQCEETEKLFHKRFVFSLLDNKMNE